MGLWARCARTTWEETMQTLLCPHLEREAPLRTAVNEARFATCSRVVAELGEKQKTLKAQK